MLFWDKKHRTSQISSASCHTSYFHLLGVIVWNLFALYWHFYPVSQVYLHLWISVPFLPLRLQSLPQVVSEVCFICSLWIWNQTCHVLIYLSIIVLMICVLQEQEPLSQTKINTRLPQLPQDIAALLPSHAKFPSESRISVDTAHNKTPHRAECWNSRFSWQILYRYYK